MQKRYISSNGPRDTQMQTHGSSSSSSSHQISANGEGKNEEDQNRANKKDAKKKMRLHRHKSKKRTKITLLAMIEPTHRMFTITLVCACIAKSKYISLSCVLHSSAFLFRLFHLRQYSCFFSVFCRCRFLFHFIFLG